MARASWCSAMAPVAGSSASSAATSARMHSHSPLVHDSHVCQLQYVEQKQDISSQGDDCGDDIGYWQRACMLVSPPAGGRYEGEFAYGFAHGLGMHTRMNGEIYRGEYLLGKRHGCV